MKTMTNIKHFLKFLGIMMMKFKSNINCGLYQQLKVDGMGSVSAMHKNIYFTGCNE